MYDYVPSTALVAHFLAVENNLIKFSINAIKTSKDKENIRGSVIGSVVDAVESVVYTVNKSDVAEILNVLEEFEEFFSSVSDKIPYIDKIPADTQDIQTMTDERLQFTRDYNLELIEFREAEFLGHKDAEKLFKFRERVFELISE